jgi:hypothetical protein
MGLKKLIGLTVFSLTKCWWVTRDAPLPDGAAVIGPAARFLADAEEIVRRDAPGGVVWPDNWKVADLTLYLDRLAVVVLTYSNAGRTW